MDSGLWNIDSFKLPLRVTPHPLEVQEESNTLRLYQVWLKLLQPSPSYAGEYTQVFIFIQIVSKCVKSVSKCVKCIFSLSPRYILKEFN